eukprot:gene13579-18222_t
MYGWIVESFQDLIVSNYGIEKWEEILTKAAFVPDKVRSDTYPDGDVFRLVIKATEVLSIDLDTILEMQGQAFIRYSRETGYENLLKCQGSNLREWLGNVNELHRLLQTTMTELVYPEFWCMDDPNDTSGNTIILHYFSKRGPVFVPLVVGIVREISQHYFNLSIEMERIALQGENNSEFTTWRIKQIHSDISDNDRLNDTGSGKFNNISFVSTVMDASKKSSLQYPSCPFSSFLPDNINEFKYSAPPPPPDITAARSLHQPSVSESHGIGLTGDQMQDIFPYHIAVDSKLNIIQVGSALQKYFENINSLSKFCPVPHQVTVHGVGKNVGDYFSLVFPPKCFWDWDKLRLALESNFELKFCDFRGVTTPTYSLKGGLFISNPEAFADLSKDNNSNRFCAFFFLQPNVTSIKEMNKANLQPNDIPKHNLQRDLLFLGEHLAIESEQSTNLQKLSKNLEAAKKKALNALQMKAVFVRYVSHEIRTPLNITLLGLKLLLDELNHNPIMRSSPELKQCRDILIDLASDIKSSSTIGVDLLNDLLLYEKLDGGHIALDKSDVSLWQFISEQLKVFKIQAISSQVELKWNESCVKGVCCNVDCFKIAQVVRNLVSNAIKFTPKGGTVEVFAEIIPRDVVQNDEKNDSNKIKSSKGPYKSIKINISDTGSGLSELQQSQLFQQFTQFDASKQQNGQGSGLGLWISSNIIKLHGGNIGVFSNGIGFGSTFYIELPILKIIEERTETSKGKNLELINADESSNSNYQSPLGTYRSPISGTPIISGTPTEFHSMSSEYEPDRDHHIRTQSELTINNENNINRILIVDDSDTNRSLLSRTFSNIPIRNEARDGFECIELLQAADDSGLQYDIVLIDDYMPEISGAETVIELRDLGYNGLIIGMSSSKNNEEIDEFLDSGINFLLTKPIKKALFWDYVRIHQENLKQQQKLLSSIGSNNSLVPSSDILKINSLSSSHYNNQSKSSKYKRLLIVDDAPTNRKMIDRLLKDIIPHRDQANDAVEALKLVDESIENDLPYDVMFVDHYMPSMFGPELVKNIRMKGFLGLIIGVTGSDYQEDKDAFMDAGANRVLLKPLNVTLLMELLSTKSTK